MFRSLIALSALFMSAAAYAQDVYQEKSLYRNILVYDDQGLRCMRFGRANAGRQSCVSLQSPDALVLDYTRMLLASLYLKPDPGSILIIGLGGGTLPRTLRKILPQAKIDTVELDPSVAKVAARFFGFLPGRDGEVFIEDGRVFVKRAQKQGKKYDLIVLDAFDHVYIPEHLLTREYLGEVRSLLAPGGVLAANTFSSSKLYDAKSTTYAGVFGAYYNPKTSNRVILARGDRLPPMAEIAANAERLEGRLQPFGAGKDWLLPLFSTGVQWPPTTRILTDQYSPANLLNGGGGRPTGP